MRRLTRREYTNAVRDLLRVDQAEAEPLTASFPEDDRVGGFAGNAHTSVNQRSLEAYMASAESLAALAPVEALVPCDPAAMGEAECGVAWLRDFGRAAFRRPLDAREDDALAAVFREKLARSSFDGAVRLVVEAVLQAPSFLYRVEAATHPEGSLRALDPWELATRLSFFLWSSIPDEDLLDAAEAGQLETTAGLEAEARRMLADPKAADGFESFHLQWLGLQSIENLEKDPVLFPEFDPALRDAMASEPRRFLRHVFQEEGAGIETLLSAEYTFAEDRLASLYGASATTDGRVDLPPGERSGLLTQAGFLAVTTPADQGSPILRGKFVREHLLCQTIPEPPDSLMITAPTVEPGVSTRERFEQHRSEPVCASCHRLMDPIGFGFDNYDAIGRWADEDGASPIDARGEILDAGSDVAGTFEGVPGLVEKLLGTDTLHECVTRHWMRYALARSERESEACSVEQAMDRFAVGDIRELMIGVVLSDAFRFTRGME